MNVGDNEENGKEEVEEVEKVGRRGDEEQADEVEKEVQLEEKEDAETERFSIAQYHDFITYLRCEALGHLPQNIWRNLWNSVRVFPDQPQNTSTSHGYMNFVKKLRHVGDDITVILLMHL